jgi:hypothetical protein
MSSLSIKPVNGNNNQQFSVSPSPVSSYASSFSEIALALSRGDFSKFFAWLQKNGWAEEEVGFFRWIARRNIQVQSIHFGVLRDTIEKKQLDLFTTVSEKFLSNYETVRDIMVIIKEKLNKSACKEDLNIYKQMENVVAATVNLSTFEKAREYTRSLEVAEYYGNREVDSYDDWN